MFIATLPSTTTVQTWFTLPGGWMSTPVLIDWEPLDLVLKTVADVSFRATSRARPWRQALREAAKQVATYAVQRGALAGVVQRLSTLESRLDAHDRHGVMQRLVRSLVSTQAHRNELFQAVNNGLGTTTIRDIVHTWAFNLPIPGRYLIQDIRFWRSVGQRPYSVWPRVLDDQKVEVRRTWRRMSQQEQDDVLPKTWRSSPINPQRTTVGQRCLNPLVRWRIRAVRFLEASGWMEQEADQPWVHQWLRIAIEWGNAARVHAAVNAGVRLDGMPSSMATDILIDVVRSCFYPLNDRRNIGPAEALKTKIWTDLVRAGLPVANVKRSRTVGGYPPGLGNGPLWRCEVERGQTWEPAVVHAFACLHLQGWNEQAAGGLSPLGWAQAHGLTKDKWTLDLVIDVLVGMKRDDRARLDDFLTTLNDQEVRWDGAGTDHDDDRGRMVHLALKQGVSPRGIAALASMGGNFLWTHPDRRTLLMSVLRRTRQGTQQQVVQALLNAVEVRHGKEERSRLLHAVDTRGATALHWAARALDEPLVAFLTEQGISATHVDRSGRNTLHWVAQKTWPHHAKVSLSMVNMLLAQGVNPWQHDDRGTSALDALVERIAMGAVPDLLASHLSGLWTVRHNGLSWLDMVKQRRDTHPIVVEKLMLTATLAINGQDVRTLERRRPARRL